MNYSSSTVEKVILASRWRGVADVPDAEREDETVQLQFAPRVDGVEELLHRALAPKPVAALRAWSSAFSCRFFSLKMSAAVYQRRVPH